MTQPTHGTLLTADGKRHRFALPPAGAAAAKVPGLSCPHCAAAELHVQGSGMRPSADDRAYEATGHCSACKGYVGQLRVEVSTIFGVREDEAVLVHGRCRVY